MPSLFDQFLSEEITPEIRSRLEGALANGQMLQRLSFNRFDLTIDRVRNVVLLEDVTDAGPSGAETVPLSTFRL